jgi:hypothetical protein
LHPARFLPSTDAWRLEFVGDGEEDDVLWIYAEITTKVESTVHGDILIAAV